MRRGTDGALRGCPALASYQRHRGDSAPIVSGGECISIGPSSRELRNLLFTIYCPRIQVLLVDVSEEFPAGHILLFGALLPGVTKMGGWFPVRKMGRGGGIGGVFGCVSLFVVEELSGIEGLPRQWLHLNGDQSRQTEETERGGSSGGRQYNV